VQQKTVLPFPTIAIHGNGDKSSTKEDMAIKNVSL